LSWQAHLKKLSSLTFEEAEIFAPPREMEAAIASYNRALANLRADSADIAQIALRKLVIQYPLFGPAGLLYAACLFELKRLDAATELIHRSRLAGLRPGDVQMADALLAAIQNEQESLAPTHVNLLNRPASGASILEKTRKSGKAKMASRKEVLEVVRHGDRVQQEETFVADEATPGQHLRRIVLVTGISLGVILIVFLGLFVYRLILDRSSAVIPDTDERLSYLLDRLGALSAEDPRVAELMEDYAQFVAPPASETETTPTQSLPETETTVGSTVPVMTTQQAPPSTSEPAQTVGTTSPTDLLTQIYSEYQAALLLAKTDVVAAAENLLKMSEASASLDPALQSPAVPMSVDNLNTSILTSLDQYRVKAAEILRAEGNQAYENKDNQTSLDYYLRAYALEPLYYGGGVAYYCGRNYQALGQHDQARPYYELVIEKFPGREIAGYAQIRLSEMGFPTPSPETTAAPATTSQPPAT
jgi:tetratricopeptide (TPR) repeat protein